MTVNDRAIVRDPTFEELPRYQKNCAPDQRLNTQRNVVDRTSSYYYNYSSDTRGKAGPNDLGKW